MTISNESKLFFSKFSKIWQNFKDYTYLEGINLSPEQISIIEQDEDQLLIEGYAGTGKSLTLLYKFINVLVREEGKRILFVSFNKTLIDDTKKRLNSSKEFIENKDRHFTRIATFHEIATEILKENKVIERGIGKVTVEAVKKQRDTSLRYIAAITAKYKEEVNEEYKSLSKDERLYKTHDEGFITDEISWLKSMGFIKKEKYLETERTGRTKSIRLTRAQRNTIFKIYEEYEEQKKNKFNNALDLEDYALKIIENSYLIDDSKKFDYIFVDEVQDLDPMQIKALCMLTRKSIILSGDAKQRIYKKSPVKYEDLGLNIKEKGKRKILNKNFRSTAEIVKLANSLKFYDTDDKLSEKHFVRSGDRPIIHKSDDDRKAIRYIRDEIRKIHAIDDKKVIAIIHREDSKAKRGYGKSNFRLVLEQELLLSITDINNFATKFDYKDRKQVFYANAYDVKGLEFDVVFIIDFNHWYYPNAKEIEKIKSANEGKDQELINSDILDVINREKKLLYVAMTRAKDKLYLVANKCKSEYQISNFIYDFNPSEFECNFTKRTLENNRILHEAYINALLGESKQKKNEGDNKDIYEKHNKHLEIKKEDNANEIAINNNEIFNSNKSDTIGKQKTKEEIKNTQENKKSNISISEIIDNEVKPYLNDNKITFVDKRDKGGALWVIGGNELKGYMNELNSKGIKFTFTPRGGKASKHMPAWYMVSK